MQQSKFAGGQPLGTIAEWIRHHNSDYGAVRDRLEAVRNVVLHGRLDAAAEVLRKSYVFAVLSQRTAQERHERAFTAYCAGDVSLKEASLKTVYGGNKAGWMQDTMQSTDWEVVALAIRSHMRAGRQATTLQAIVDNLKGVAHRKGAFMLAMAGLYEYMCIDSNVARYAGFEESLSFEDSEEYLQACRDIARGAYDNPYVPPFIIQWAIYDFERGEHSRHMAFFTEVLGV